MTIKSKFKILVGRFEDYYGKITEEYKEVTFEELCKIKGIKTLRKQTDTFSYRARTDRPKTFSGAYATQLVNGKLLLKSATLEELAISNNISAYVNAWRSMNNLTQ